MSEKEERKTLLRDWMASTTVMAKVKDPNLNAQSISQLWYRNFGIKMKAMWVERALYGTKPPPKS